ncbi:hypothetical protein RintRC_5921 [Richelia intracellularis]|nr:hypothetical protein RintRC_5921 [Richelia intracellularis]
MVVRALGFAYGLNEVVPWLELLASAMATSIIIGAGVQG